MQSFKSFKHEVFLFERLQFSTVTCFPTTIFKAQKELGLLKQEFWKKSSRYGWYANSRISCSSKTSFSAAIFLENIFSVFFRGTNDKVGIQVKNCEFCFVSLTRQKLLTQFPIEKYLSKERLVVHSLRILKFYCSLIVIANFLKKSIFLP